MIIKKSPEEIEKMAAAGAIHARTMKIVEAKIREGVSTRELDEAAEKYIRSQGAVPSFKGYRGFPGSICASPNAMVVHGIPGNYRLQRGDILSVDIGVTLDGWVADGACTFPVGPITPVAERLLEVTEASLFDAVAQARPGNRLGDISWAVQSRVEEAGMSVVRTLVGHGVRISGPPEVIATVNSKCAASEPSWEKIAQPSPPTRTAGSPAVIIGSTASTMPSSSSGPLPGLP